MTAMPCMHAYVYVCTILASFEGNRRLREIYSSLNTEIGKISRKRKLQRVKCPL